MRGLLSIILFVLSIQLVAQSPRIGRFFLSKTSNNKVIVNWSMKAGSTCLELQVERKIDGEFQVVYTYPSVCGDAEEEVFYSWIDVDVPNYSIAEYRIKLETTEYTLPEQIDLDAVLSQQEIVVYPNPVSQGQLLNLKFRNQFQPKRFLIFNQYGQIVYSQEIKQEKEFQLNSRLNKGKYYLHLEGSGFTAPVSFIVK